MIRRLIDFFFVARFVVVVFFTTIVTSMSPQRPAVPGDPVNDLVAVTTFTFAVVAFWAVAAPHAFTPGRARVAVPRTAVIARRTWISFLR